jgi:hypothetical protein
MAQLGIVFQAAVVVAAVFAPSVIGRWLAAISRRSASGRSCACPRRGRWAARR